MAITTPAMQLPETMRHVAEKDEDEVVIV